MQFINLQNQKSDNLKILIDDPEGLSYKDNLLKSNAAAVASNNLGIGFGPKKP